MRLIAENRFQPTALSLPKRARLGDRRAGGTSLAAMERGRELMRKLALTKIVLAMLAAFGAWTPAQAEEAASSRETIVPDAWKSSYESLHYAPAVKAGGWVYLSGVVAGLAPDETEEDLEAAFARSFDAIETILTEAGAEWSDVVEIITYHTDLPAQIAAFGAAKDRYMKEPYPAWTAIDIDRLYPDNGLVEIKVTAYVGE